MKTIPILGVNISCVTPYSAARQIIQWAKDKHRTYVCVAPVATLVNANQDPSYMAVVNGAGMVTPDGMPVVWLARLKGAELSRTYGPDLMIEVFRQDKKLKHHFIGHSHLTITILQRDYGWCPLDKADIVWVGYGGKMQDEWMAKHKLNSVQVGVGVALDFLASVKPQAPLWMQRSGLEWFFRLCCEPGRLWKRYLIGNSLFIYYVIKDIFSCLKK